MPTPSLPSLPSLPPIHPAARQRARQGQGVSLLVWHDLIAHESERLVWFDTTTALFEAQLARLTHAGAHPISLANLTAYLTHGSPSPPRGAVLLCFDDNTVGIHEEAAPRLARRGWPWVLSAHTAYVGVATSKRHNDWEAIRAMEKQGANVVSQTHTHPPDLRLLSDVALQREMNESRRRMESNLGHAVPYVTYPSGKWDTRVARAAQAAGYRLALTEDFGAAETSPHLLGIHRYSTHRRFDEAVQAIARAAGK